MRVLNFFGSKVRHARKYPHPRYIKVVEPCAGGAGYSLAHLTHEVVLYDIRSSVTRVWQYLIRSKPDEILALPLILPGQHVNQLECSEDGRLLISWALNVGGVPDTTLKRWYAEGGDQMNRWSPKRRFAMAKLCSKVKHWRCEQLDWVGLLNHSLRDGPATYFVDPPYQEARLNRYGTPKLDYVELAKVCRALPGQVIVCEQLGATWLPFRPLYEVTSALFERSTEVVWCSDWERQ